MGKREDQLGVISIAMVGKAMRANDRAKRVCVQREEQRTQDRALRDPSSKRTRLGHSASPGYPVGAITEVG